MAAQGVIAAFLASVGFEADEKSLQTSLTRVAAFTTAVAVLAGGAMAALTRLAGGEAELAAQADKLGTTTERLREMHYVAEQTGSSAETLDAALQAIMAKNPRIRDAASAFDLVGRRMAGLSEHARKLYAQRMGIDVSLIPMLTDDVSGLRAEFAAMYAESGTDARQAAAASRGLLAEIGKLKTLAGLLARATGMAFMDKARQTLETLRRAVMDNFGRIRRMLEGVIGFLMRVAGAIGAFIARLIKWASAAAEWFDGLSAGQRKVVTGLALLVSAWKTLNLAFLATPLGAVIAGLTSIVALVDDYLTYMEGGESLFDWGPLAGTIELCVGACKTLWDALVSVGGVMADVLLPLLKTFAAQARWVVETATALFKALGQALTGDFSGALDTLSGQFATWAARGREIVEGLCAFIRALFKALWDGVVAMLPDFAAWAENAAKTIRDAFNAVFGWINDKVAAIADYMPDFVKKKMGWNTAPAVPSGPALTPSAAQGAALANNSTSSQTVNAKTEIVINGAGDPVAVGREVAGRQNSVNADLVRNTRGVAR